jgi:hypothetical protein
VMLDCELGVNEHAAFIQRGCARTAAPTCSSIRSRPDSDATRVLK